MTLLKLIFNVKLPVVLMIYYSLLTPITLFDDYWWWPILTLVLLMTCWYWWLLMSFGCWCCGHSDVKALSTTTEYRYCYWPDISVIPVIDDVIRYSIDYSRMMVLYSGSERCLLYRPIGNDSIRGVMQWLTIDMTWRYWLLTWPSDSCWHWPAFDWLHWPWLCDWTTGNSVTVWTILWRGRDILRYYQWAVFWWRIVYSMTW